MPLSKLSRREISSRPGRSLLTLLSIVIGVSAIVATYLSTDSATLAQMAMVQVVTGDATLEVESVVGNSFDEALLEELKGIPGVTIASPVLRRYSSMAVPDAAAEEDSSSNDAAGSSQNEAGGENAKQRVYRVQLLGVVPSLDRQVRGYSVVEGKSLEDAEPGTPSVLIDESFAKSARVQVGSEIRVLTRSSFSRRRAKVVGLVKAKSAAAGLQSGLIVADLKLVQAWSKANKELDAIQIVTSKEADRDKVAEAIKAKLPNGVQVRQPTLRSQVAEETTIAMQQGLRLATAIALLISVLTIYNTFQMNVGERRRQLGILRCLGSTRKQILWMIVREGLWLGLIGTFFGCLLGHFGAALLRHSTARVLQIDIPPGPFSFFPYLIAVACGLIVAMVGAFFPALRASLLSPSEAMRVVSTGEVGISQRIWLIFGTIIMLIGTAIQILTILRWIDISHAVIGVVALKLGVIFLLPSLIDVLTAWVAWLLSFAIRTEVKLARRQILRNRGRSSLTIGVVFIAMGGGLGMASTILDNINNVKSWYQRAIIGDFFIRAAMPDMNSGQAADMPDGLTERVAATPGVALVDTLRFVRARSNETSVVVVVRQFNSNTQDYFDLIEGEESSVMKGIRSGDVVLGSVLSQRLNLHKGDTMPLETNEGSTTLRIAGVTNEYIAGGLTLYMDSTYAKKLLDVEGTDVIVVKAKPDELASVEKQLRALSDESGLMFQSYVDLVNIIQQKTNGATGGLWLVLALGSLIAAFGLINTLAMNILEQTREIGMLRVVAMTRWQIRRMILAQSLIMGLIGIIPGVVTGIWVAYVVNLTTMPVTGHDVEFRIYPWLLWGAALFELLVVVVAAMLPAERAARLNMSKALQYE